MMRDSWNKILKFLEKGLNPGLYKVWIKPLKAEVSSNSIKLYAPNDFVAAWVRDRLMENIKEAGEQVLGTSPKVEIGVRKSVEKPAAKAAPAKPAVARPVQTSMGLPMMSSAVVNTRIPRWRFSFDDFVIGESNRLACAASRSLCDNSLPGDQLFMSSAPGLGKTHLLHSIGKNLCASSNKKHISIACLTAEEFANRMVLALKAGEISRFKSEFRDNVDCLLLEDIHFFQGKQKMQDEILETLKSLQLRGSKVVMTSSFLPRELDKVDQQLVSRFSSGLLALISTPDFETRKKIVESKAMRLGTHVPDSISELLADRITTDVRQLESCLQNLVLKARLLNRDVSQELAWQVLENYSIAKAAPSYDSIVDHICSSYELTPEQLRSKSRKRQIVLARNTAFFLARKHTELSLKDIGTRLGRRHSTVIKGITNIEREISLQTPLGRQLQDTIDRLTP
ncbi:chromosomal replication initiator protein DnaA [Desulfovibrio sp. JC010]|uniref:chromosomal replication initiator protein DnaA n=1 Tax=Desulfovibrio sp. JC010 TaxID=2593641 RepID=UPI0013D7820A|nr:chromosomal replication initiator protein DnaA [Desulfovibrio sp. JC010]NDV27798.1 chromosomal replication initiator protein DnaA [Desulfovibrio sp. JC010]